MALLSRSRLFVVVLTGVLALSLVLGIRVIGGRAHTRARSSAAAPTGAPSVRGPSASASGANSTAAATVHTPKPIPGYLIIADRGNNRILLVDSTKHVLWTYPR